MKQEKSKGMFDEVKRRVTLTIKQAAGAVVNYARFVTKWKSKVYRFHFEEDGNSKMGHIASWSTLLGDYTYHGLGKWFNGIKGTCVNCGACVSKCYVRASYRYAAVVLNHAVNTWGLRKHLDKVENDLAEQLGKGKITIARINQSGELENADQLAMWCRLASGFTNVQFYLYTKNFKLVGDFLENGLVPKNLTILYSVWHDVGVKEFNSQKNLPNVKAFVYDDGTLAITPKAYCPAYKNGKLDHEWPCSRCGLCFRSKVNVIGCKEH